ncbi:hypothetical protein OAG53_01035 [Akkermansiaceae bacterium]|nr:hypothetical protein [Akkermansiaceae bacterium]
MAAGTGSGDSGGWHGFGPLLLWTAIGGSLMIAGFVMRPATKQPERGELEEPKLPTLREAEAANQNRNAQQGVDLNT